MAGVSYKQNFLVIEPFIHAFYLRSRAFAYSELRLIRCDVHDSEVALARPIEVHKRRGLHDRRALLLRPC